MAYDPISRTVLFYGFPVASGGGVTASAQTWAWNGTDWAQVGGGSAPTSSFPPAGVMFTAGDHVLLLPGSSVEVGGRDVTQTWEWDGLRWTLLHPALDLPGGISPFVGAYDPDTHQLVVNDEIDTWIWNESTWRRVHPTVQLPALGYVAYLPALHQVVSWGDVSRGLDAGTYGWTGTDWSVIRSGSANPAQEVGKGYLGLMTPDEAATAVRPLLTGVHPVLLPTYMPAGWDAVVTITPDGFSILYQSDQRDKSITFGIIVPNPPPGGPQSKDSFVKFRQALALKYQKPGYAEYFVYDATNPLSQRWLMWIEPGTMTNPPLAGPGVPYFLSATGVADAEFWQVANSLK